MSAEDREIYAYVKDHDYIKLTAYLATCPRLYIDALLLFYLAHIFKLCNVV